MQAFGSIVCGCFCIKFIDFMLVSKSLKDFTNLIFSHNFKKNDSRGVAKI